MEIEKQTYNQLITEIGGLLQQGRQQAVQSVNTILVQTYCHIGQDIVEFEQKGNERAEYGSQLFERLSKDLTQAYGKGFSRSNLLYMRKLYQCFPMRLSKKSSNYVLLSLCNSVNPLCNSVIQIVTQLVPIHRERTIEEPRWVTEFLDILIDMEPLL